MIYTIYTVLALVIVSIISPRPFRLILTCQLRIAFRLAEYSQGFDSTIPNHEAYQYALDSTPMLLALVVLNVLHPGRLVLARP